MTHSAVRFYALEVDAPDPASLEARVRAAEAAGYAFVTFPDDPLRGGIEAGVRAAFLARRTTRIGLAPTLHATTTEPFHLATQLASLDHASLGRAGWVVGATSDPAALATVGRTEVDPAEVGDVVDVARRLWDSWEDDAIIRDVPTGRFLDPARVHHVHFESPRFSIVGPLITTRPPQGQVVVIGSPALGITDRLDVLVVEPGADVERGDALVFAAVPAGFDVSTLDGAADGVLIRDDGGELAPVPAPSTAATLRQALGLARPANRFARARGTA
ncbi:LLM class flavin-dependent oxidoreductase [Dactylosporangium vinaceum]|uniref:LLM class flavin-dependent oxidoreductase n=1 Tax=Dactylosporangium vinaceum TaxID=53362 RepID=A0ABV5M7U6_9ACTN|nr:LLM class flavin-dependent oxidoreductase [Dactylosporangium vinaceum]UAB92287.1 LLM class flavin-dependent oxidoreductase [Dactylosporangium vinaceum]